jgi:hypothetical protein
MDVKDLKEQELVMLVLLNYRYGVKTNDLLDAKGHLENLIQRCHKDLKDVNDLLSNLQLEQISNIREGKIVGSNEKGILEFIRDLDGGEH